MRCRIDVIFATTASIIMLSITNGGCVSDGDGSLEGSPEGNLGMDDKLQSTSRKGIDRRIMRPLVEYGPGFSKTEGKPFNKKQAVNKLKQLFFLKWKLYGKPTTTAPNRKTTTTEPSTTTTKTSTTTTTSKPSTTTKKPITTTSKQSTTTKKITTTSKPSTITKKNPTTTTKKPSTATRKPSTTTKKPTTTSKPTTTNAKNSTPVKVIINRNKKFE